MEEAVKEQTPAQVELQTHLVVVRHPVQSLHQVRGPLQQNLLEPTERPGQNLDWTKTCSRVGGAFGLVLQPRTRPVRVPRDEGTTREGPKRRSSLTPTSPRPFSHHPSGEETSDLSACSTAGRHGNNNNNTGRKDAEKRGIKEKQQT